MFLIRGFAFSPSIGSAGGVMCCWDKTIFYVSECVIEWRFVAMKGQWLDGASPEGLVSVYAPMDGNDRVDFF